MVSSGGGGGCGGAAGARRAGVREDGLLPGAALGGRVALAGRFQDHLDRRRLARLLRCRTGNHDRAEQQASGNQQMRGDRHEEGAARHRPDNGCGIGSEPDGRVTGQLGRAAAASAGSRERRFASGGQAVMQPGDQRTITP